MKKINLYDIKGKLTKEQMKTIMAGSICSGSCPCDGGCGCKNNGCVR